MSNHSMPAQGTDPPFLDKSIVLITHEQNIICRKTLICRQLLADHVVSSRPMKRKEKIHRGWVKIILVKVEEIFLLIENIFGRSWTNLFVEWNYFGLRLNKYLCWMKLFLVEVEQISLLNESNFGWSWKKMYGDPQGQYNNIYGKHAHIRT